MDNREAGFATAMVVASLFLAAIIASGIGIGFAVADQQRSAAPAVSGVSWAPAQQAAIAPLAQQNVPQRAAPSGVTVQEAQAWCSGACGEARFAQLQEGPNAAVHFTTGQAVTFTVPVGIAVDNWDCYATTHPVGPARISACEATFRRL